MQREPAILCFGHPLLDMMADVSEEFLEHHGITAGNVDLAKPSQISVFTELLENNKSVGYVPGGASMNTARMIAWTRPELPVYYVGSLGNDKFGEIIREALEKAGVKQLFETYTRKPTGTCAGLVCNKERSLLAHLGAAVELSMKHIESPAVKEAIEKATVYYSEGFVLNTASSPENLLLVAENSRASIGKLFCFNLSAPYLFSAFKDRMSLIMPLIDIIFGSEIDIMGYAGVMWPEEFEAFSSNVLSEDKKQKVLEAVEKTGRLPCTTQRGYRIVVITCGADETIVWDGKKIFSREVPHVEPSDIIDLNGAGDSFVAGFLSQYLHNFNLLDSVDAGHSVARNCISHNGAMVSGEPPALKRK